MNGPTPRNLLCELLKKARNDVNLTQVQVARMLLRRQTFLTRIESGEHRVIFIEVEQLARIYGKPLQYFATIEEVERKNPALIIKPHSLDSPPRGKARKFVGALTGAKIQ